MNGYKMPKATKCIPSENGTKLIYESAIY